jgi:anti-anti-sigma regulatory factor
MKTAHPSGTGRRTTARTNVRAIFPIHGDVNGIAVTDLRRDLTAFAGETDGDVVVDCLDLDSIDDAGVAALLSFHNEMLATARRVRVRRVPARCRDAFESNHLMALFGSVGRPRPRLI